MTRARLFRIDQAEIAPHRQGLGDLHHIFVMHLHARHGRQRLVQHGGAGPARLRR